MKTNFTKVLLILSLAIVYSYAYSGADASARNSCVNGKKYKAKAKVNGPNGCARTVIRENNCQEANTGLLILYKKTENCDCLGPNANFLNPVGASARAISDENEVSDYAFKAGGCRRYRAGGEMNPINDMELNSFEGVVESNASFKDFHVDYSTGKLILNDFNAKLKIESNDFENEFSLFQIVINSIVTRVNGQEEIMEIYKSEVYFQNGKINLFGNKLLLESDFERIRLEKGFELKFNTKDLIIDLGSSLDPSLTIEVTLKGDVGNILTGNSELHQFDYTLLTSYNQETRSHLVILESETNKLLNLTIRAINGNILHYLSNINLIANERKVIVLDNAIFQSSNDGMFLLQTQSSEGYIRNSVIFHNQ